jgi:hypothetical protein
MYTDMSRCQSAFVGLSVLEKAERRWVRTRRLELKSMGRN